MKQTWIKALREKGVVVEQEPATDYINIEVSLEDTEDC
jgi:predicted ATPase